MIYLFIFSHLPFLGFTSFFPSVFCSPLLFLYIHPPFPPLNFPFRLSYPLLSLFLALLFPKLSHRCLREWRIKMDGGRNLFEGARSPPSWYIRAGLRVYTWLRTNTLWHQGIGRLAHLQVRKLTWRDLQALSDYLGVCVCVIINIVFIFCIFSLFFFLY